MWEGVGLASDRRVIELPFDKVQAATLSDDIMWVLADGQLAVADLTSGTVKVVAEIETSDWGSHLLAPQGQQNVFYAVGVDDSSTLLGHATHIGWYDRQAKQARLLTTLVGGVKLSGTAASGDILYAVRFGGDGGFGTILPISLENGTIVAEIELERTGLGASMSPDGQWLSIIDGEWGDTPWQGYITIYNLTEPDTLPTTIELPRQPSHARALMWTPDSQYLYFVLCPGSWASEARQPCSLWRLAAFHDSDIEEIVSSIQPDCIPVAMSPDSRAVLIGDISFTLIDVQTKAQCSLDLPPEARILAWHKSRAQ